jgi:hypothetical protein
MGGGWLTPRRGRFDPEKEPVPIVQEVGGPQGQAGRVRKISSLLHLIPGPSNP